ncbi:MAG TPA: hypothetical protein VHG71_09085 [Verrucomicrobiae bacterium]|nr:hypothetical protein [Verrucomicrobiae bacterium]
MSYDLQIYSCSDPNVELVRLAVEEGFERNGNAFSLRGKNWQLIFHSTDKVEPEDIPASVFRELPGITYLTEANLEGAASATDRAKVIRVAKKFARATRGVLVNPQEDTIETARGLKRVDLANVPKEESTLKLSWWFEDADSFEKTGYARLVEAFESFMPEALPRRYGCWEPPQFKFAETGREHFLSFFRENLRKSIVWYANHPFSYVFVSVPPKVGGTWQGYRCCELQLQLQSRVLSATGWPLALKRLWLAVAQIVSPFFAEIRDGGEFGQSWWWNGIPRTLNLATMIGAPYDKLWPDFVAASKSASPNLFFIETIEERKPLSIIPPEEIAQPKTPDEPRTFTAAEFRAYKSPARKYPPIWPFSEPFVKQ